MAKAKWNDSGLADFIAAFKDLDDRSMEEIAGTALYAMANVAANQVAANIAALKTSPERHRKTDEAFYLSPRQKWGLENGFGIAKKKADDKGGWNVRLGFDGYNTVVTEKYPNGQPNAMIARTVESGSTYMIKQPFFRKAINAAKKSAVQAGEDAVIREFKKKI